MAIGSLTMFLFCSQHICRRLVAIASYCMITGRVAECCVFFVKKMVTWHHLTLISSLQEIFHQRSVRNKKTIFQGEKLRGHLMGKSLEKKTSPRDQSGNLSWIITPDKCNWWSWICINKICFSTKIFQGLMMGFYHWKLPRFWLPFLERWCSKGLLLPRQGSYRYVRVASERASNETTCRQGTEWHPSNGV